jgi:transcriptional repressor NrdR
MKCPFCGKSDTKVTNKRDSRGIVRRRRECLKCSQRFTTYEKPEDREFMVVKKDGRRVPFIRDKITMGITKACEKRPISHADIEKIVSDIESKIRKKKGKEVKSTYIGELVMNNLKKLDKIAYVRFASVYKDFQDISDFKKEIREVTSK